MSDIWTDQGENLDAVTGAHHLTATRRDAARVAMSYALLTRLSSSSMAPAICWYVFYSRRCELDRLSLYSASLQSRSRFAYDSLGEEFGNLTYTVTVIFASFAAFAFIVREVDGRIVAKKWRAVP